MSKQPLILFPQPELVKRLPLYGGPGSIHFPSHARQVERLTPMFKELETAFIAIQATAAGTAPEQVLVIQIVGYISDFVNAVKQIKELEWMGELETDNIKPDADFYNLDNKEAELDARLFLLMANQTAMNQLLSLWSKYSLNKEMKFDRGKGRFRELFKRIKTIRRWNVQDRLLETGVIDRWKEELAYSPAEILKCEIEFWFKSDENKRNSNQFQVEQLLKEVNGRIISTCVLQQISYHAVLAEFPRDAVESIIANPNTELVKSNEVMFFRPCGQFSLKGDLSEKIEITVPQQKPFPAQRPVIALLDGLPLENHPMLIDRLFVDDPDDWASMYPVAARVHGTGMASLIVHGDLNELESPPLTGHLYVRPILKSRAFDQNHYEESPENLLAVDLIHRAVRRLYVGEGAAPSVKIINLSYGDAYRPFIREQSPLARLLDWLSYEYNVLFIVSSGNHPSPILLDISEGEFKNLNSLEKQALIIKALFKDCRHRRILSPAENINGLTVGALHYDESPKVYFGSRFDPFESTLPSPISAFGSGYRRSVKPDLVYPGGKLLYEVARLNPSKQIKIEPKLFSVPPGHKTASPGKGDGIPSMAYSRGSSNAAALISRAGAFCYDYLVQLLESYALDEQYSSYLPVLIKAMIAHGCIPGEMESQLSNILGPNSKKELIRWIGYGVPELERVLSCTDQRISLIGFGSLTDGQAHIFRLPLPPSLTARREWRRLTITLAWFSPIAPNTQKYRTASLWVDVNEEPLSVKRKNIDQHSGLRGTLQHEVFEGDRAVPIVDGDFINLQVNCRKDASKILQPIRYGLFVTLEVGEKTMIPLYAEIRNRIRPQVRI